MEKFSCLVVEDEPLAAEVIEDYIRQIPFLECKGVCSDALYAMEMLKQQPIDVLFLDIHLPKLKGLDFLRTLKSPPQVILTTAYREYALDGYELDVVDYLLKPVNFNRFLVAVNKLDRQSNATANRNINPAPPPEKQHLLININKKRIKIYFDEIYYIESRKEYVNIVTATGSYLAKYPLTDIEEQLDKSRFMRVHRSFIVARERIKAFTAADLEINGETIPIGRSYKELVLAILDNRG